MCKTNRSPVIIDTLKDEVVLHSIGRGSDETTLYTGAVVRELLDRAVLSGWEARYESNNYRVRHPYP